MTLTTQLQKLILDSDRRTENCRVSPVDLWNAVRLAVTGRADGALRGAGAFDVRFPQDLGTVEFYARFVRELGEDIEIRAGSTSYRIEFEVQSEHHPGEGGNYAGVSRLLRGDTPILAAMSQSFYSTLSDDSHDYHTGRSDELFLLDERDELAAAVYTILARDVPHRAR